MKINTDAQRTEGYIYNVTDTTVTIYRDVVTYGGNISPKDIRLKTFSYNTINSVTRVRRGSVAIATLAGAVTGTLIGLATYQKPEPDGWITIDLGPRASAAAGGIFGTLAGALVGLIIHNKKFNINKDLNKFDSFKTSVLRMVDSNK
ncbi:hypothetical protein [Segetibacter koreensis]|uniref:hypothetical protein n=1 Tax=Segetibacter koreensis TaxID=398037 RepID=UPI00037F33FD|nr:hypothetical protein [Segetibacter koreensis]